MEKKLPKGYKHSLILCLNRLRNEYNLYNDEDKEVIDAIHLLKEELEFNISEE